MAWKASNTQILKEQIIKRTIIIVTFLNYISIYIPQFSFRVDNFPALNSCVNPAADVGSYSTTPPIVPLFCLLLVVVLGLIFDIKMLKFIKERNTVQPIGLVPWRSVNSTDENQDIKVPLRATFISIIMLFFGVGCFSYYYYSFSYSSLNGEFNILELSFFAFLLIPMLPLILILTIKQKVLNKTKAQPPRNLQFHDETLDQQISHLAHCLEFPEDFIDEDVDQIQEGDS